MKKLLSPTPKTIWLVVHFLLFLFPIFSILITGSMTSLYLSSVITLLLAYPSSFLLNFIFDAFGLGFIDSVLFLYAVLLVSSIIGYLQWFVFVPWLMNKVKQNIFTKDVQIVLNANVTNTRELTAAETEFVDFDWQSRMFDEKQKTPIERLFEDKND